MGYMNDGSQIHTRDRKLNENEDFRKQSENGYSSNFAEHFEFAIVGRIAFSLVKFLSL